MTEPRPAADAFLIQLAVFVSGAAGLMFEMVWFYRCGLLFGSTVWAVSIVLSSFMGGLALGGGLVGAYGARIHRFLPLYVRVEIIVAASGVGLTYLLGALPGLMDPATHTFLDVRWLVNLVRIATAFPLLLIPTTAMGATLPVLVGALTRIDDRAQPVLGRLYAWNTCGAMAGVLVAEIVLISRAGIIGTAWIAGLLNFTAAVVVLPVASRLGGHAGNDAIRPVTPIALATVPRESRRWLICAAVMGATLMALEVVWFRFLSLLTVASTLAAALMLAVVLAALAVGGWVASRWRRQRPHVDDYLPAVIFAASAAVVLSYSAFRFLTGALWAAEWNRIVWFSLVLVSIPALLSSMAFVMLGNALGRGFDEEPRLINALGAGEARAVGWLTFANTAGGVVGPVVAAFVLLPYVGMERSLFVLAAVYLMVGIVAVWPVTVRRRSGAPRRAAGLAAIVAGLVLAMFPFGLMAQTYFARATAPYAVDGARVVATSEGVGETIQLMANTWLGKPLYHRIVTNGFSMSGTHLSGKRYMRYFAYWPLILHRAPLRRALVVCYGAGVTTAALTSISSLASIDVAEISPDMAAMSDIIYPPGERPLEDPRVRLHVEDGRYFLQATADRFDLITGEPPPPLTPGTVSLYTREYFALMRDHLADGGAVTYWLPVARRGEYDVKAIVSAFCDVFEDCSLWNGTVFDWMLVGTRQLQGPTTAGAFSAAWSDPIVWPRLREIGFEVPQEIGATFLGDADDLRRLSAGTAPVTDNYPQRLRPDGRRLSLLQAPPGSEGDALAFVSAVVDPDRARSAFARSRFIRRLWPEPLATATMPFFEVQRTINRIMVEGARPLAMIEELHQLLTSTTLRRPPLWALGSDDTQQEIADTGNDGSGMVEYVVGIRALVARQYATAAQRFSEAERRGLQVPTLRPLTVYALCLAGRFDDARSIAAYRDPESPDERHFWTWIANTFGVDAASRRR